MVLWAPARPSFLQGEKLNSRIPSNLSCHVLFLLSQVLKFLVKSSFHIHPQFVLKRKHRDWQKKFTKMRSQTQTEGKRSIHFVLGFDAKSGRRCEGLAACWC